MTEFTEPPVSDHLTHHDRAHFKTYARVLDEMAEGADPAELARVVLGVDMDRDPERGYRLFEAYRKRAVWMTEHGYRELAEFGHTSWRSPSDAADSGGYMAALLEPARNGARVDPLVVAVLQFGLDKGRLICHYARD